MLDDDFGGIELIGMMVDVGRLIRYRIQIRLMRLFLLQFILNNVHSTSFVLEQ
jgi:hypothetical protein